MHKYTYRKSRLFGFKKKKIIGFISIIIGVGTLLYFFFPLISYHLYLSAAFAQSNIQSPIPQRFVLNGGSSFSGLFSSGINSVTADYKDARNWFPYQNNNIESQGAKVTEYELSIPTLGINNSKVSGTDYDLSKNLVQYFTTSKNPVDKGTSVIFGHSTLPQWFDPQNYMTIFAKLHLIKNGDEIKLMVNGQEYTYSVFAISVMNPTDPNIFSQSFDNSYITIVTCTPPGTIWKRLVVRASLTG